MSQGESITHNLSISQMCLKFELNYRTPPLHTQYYSRLDAYILHKFDITHSKEEFGFQQGTHR